MVRITFYTVIQYIDVDMSVYIMETKFFGAVLTLVGVMQRVLLNSLFLNFNLKKMLLTTH